MPTWRYRTRVLSGAVIQEDEFPHIFLLFMDMADLEPNVLLVEWFRWIFDNVCKALLMHQERLYR
jgi:hypothetical protein